MRSTRLLELIQILRQHRYPVKGADLADRLTISLRTLYRDIATLQQHGAVIEGEAGVGYVLRSGFMLPPLMFTPDEIDALVLGTRWVAGRSDNQLRDAATNALAKITAVLPPDYRPLVDDETLLVGPTGQQLAISSHMVTIRTAIRNENPLTIHYRDVNSKASERTIWPIALAFFEQTHIIVAWCVLRQEFRHFRLDRLQSITISPQRYPRRRKVLLKEWRAIECIAP